MNSSTEPSELAEFGEALRKEQQERTRMLRSGEIPSPDAGKTTSQGDLYRYLKVVPRPSSPLADW